MRGASHSLYNKKIYRYLAINILLLILYCFIHKKTLHVYIIVYIRPRPNAVLGMHSRDAYPQFADVWVPPGYHIELLRISEYGFSITPGYLASPG